MRRSRWMVAGNAVAVSAFVVVAVAVVQVGAGEAPRLDAQWKPKEALHERAHEGDTASSEAFDDRAYPKGYIAASRSRASRRAYTSQSTRLSRTQARRVRARAAARFAVASGATVRSSWNELGPASGTVPASVTYTGVASTNSGRITAMAIDPNCGSPHMGCRLWVAAAGGGVWRTADAVAPKPVWVAASTGLASYATGSLVVDPNDTTGNTLYLGTGEPNGSTDSEAGVGLYRTTDGGDHWTLVTGSPAVSDSRSIGSIAIDPTNPAHIYIGTDLARHGHSNTYGGRRTPPGAPVLGVYESVNGGSSFSLAFSRPPSAVDPAAGTGSDYFQGGVNQIALDPVDPSTVYVALFGYGIWRRSLALDSDSAFHQVFATRDPTNSFGDRTQFALAVLPTTPPNTDVRIYAGDGSDADPPTHPDAVSELWRVDQANVSAATLLGAGNNAGWTKLSNSTNGTAGYTSYNYCQDQCGYDDPVVVDPYRPDVVWLAGQMAYDEIPGAGGTPRSFGRTVVRSTDAGVHFTDMTQDSKNEGLHPDTHALVMDPFNPDWVFIGSDGGVARIAGQFTNRSAECASRGLSAPDLADCQTFLSSTPQRIDTINNGLPTLQFQDIAFNPNDPLGDLAGGTQDNGTWTSAGGWQESIGGDGGPSAIGLDGVRQHTYTGTSGDVNFHGNDPATWDYNTWPMDISGENSGFYSPLIADPTTPGTMFAGMQHVWRTPDNGGDQAALDLHCRDALSLGPFPPGDQSISCGDWEALGPDLTSASLGSRSGEFIGQLARAPSDPSTLWAATRFGRLFVSRNANAAAAASVTFTRIDTPSTPDRFVSGIAVDPADPNHAWISYSGYGAYTPGLPAHVLEAHYNSSTSTASFTDRSYDLGDLPITDVAYDPATGDLWAATDFGVERLVSGATSWVRISAGLPPVAVYGLTLAPSVHVLYAATHGRGIYRLALPAAPHAQIAGPDSAAVGDTATYDAGGSSSYSGDAVTFSWSLPDGTQSASASTPVHFTTPGTTSFSVAVTDSDGRAATATKQVTVTAPATPPPSGGTGPGAGPGGGGGPVVTPKAPVAHGLRAVLRHRRYVAVRLRLPVAATVTVRIRDEHGLLVVSKRTRRFAGAAAIMVSIPRGSRIPRGRHWHVAVALTDIAGKAFRAVPAKVAFRV